MSDCERCEGKGRIPDYLGGRLGEICPDCGGIGRSALSVPAGEREGYIVTLGRHRTIEGAVAAGGYIYVGSDINGINFPEPPPAAGEAELEPVHLGRPLTTDQALAELARRGLRSAGIWELLAFGERYPDFQRRFQIVALSSFQSIVSFRFFPYLDSSRVFRFLCLYWDLPGDEWPDDIRFLGYRR
jgi:hypothetical protein